MGNWALPPGLRFEWLPVIDSTSSELMRRLRAGELGGALLLAAGEQTAGRGRLGRSWHTAAGGALMMSLAWPLPAGCALDGLSLAAGCTLAQALNAARGADLVQLKWPNDLLLAGTAGKVGGILVESLALAATRWVVVGVGVNLRAPPGVDGAAGLDAVWAGEPATEAIGSLLAIALVQALERFARDGFAPFRDGWMRLHAWQGARVRALRAGASPLDGVAAGVDERGALLLECGARVVTITTADVSLRRC
jgi:BirA family biotin operon repressor/biotin-[acetyl-CoA-carboxylase] ligase